MGAGACKEDKAWLHPGLKLCPQAALKLDADASRYGRLQPYPLVKLGFVLQMLYVSFWAPQVRFLRGSRNVSEAFSASHFLLLS